MGVGLVSLLKALRRKGRRPWILQGSIFNYNHSVVVSVRGSEVFSGTR